MARIAGVDLPKNKAILVSLSYIYGIGQIQSSKILDVVAIDHKTKTNVQSNSWHKVTQIRSQGGWNHIDPYNYKVRGPLKPFKTLIIPHKTL